MNTQTQKAVLIFSGATIAIIGSCYVPVEKVRPSREFIETTYMSPRELMGRKVMVKDFAKSEQRKQILQEIRETRNLIAKKQQQLDMISSHNRSATLMETMIATVEQNSKTRIGTIVYNRSVEIGVPKRLLDAKSICKRKGIVVVEEFEIV